HPAAAAARRHRRARCHRRGDPHDLPVPRRAGGGARADGLAGPAARPAPRASGPAPCPADRAQRGQPARAFALPGPFPQPRPAAAGAPSPPAAARASLRQREQAAATALLAKLTTAPPALAQLLASIAASEATHALLLTPGRRPG